MAKGDWEVYEDGDRDREDSTVVLTPCAEYGHSFETVLDDTGKPVVVGTEFVRKCNDCGDTYTYDPEDEKNG